MDDGEIIILASDSGSDDEEIVILGCEHGSNSILEDSTHRPNRHKPKKSRSKVVTSVTSIDDKKQAAAQAVCETNFEFPTSDENGLADFRRNSNTKSDFRKLHLISSLHSSTGDESSILRRQKNGESGESNALRYMKKDGLISHTSTSSGHNTTTGMLNTGKNGCRMQNNRQNINNSMSMTSSEKCQVNKTEQSTSAYRPSFGIEEKSSTISGEEKRPTLDEMFDDDVQIAIAISLQPQYMPNVDSKDTSCDDEEDGVEKYESSIHSTSRNDKIMQLKQSGKLSTNVEKPHHVYKTETFDRKGHSLGKTKRRKKLKHLTRTTKYRKLSNTYTPSQDFDSKENVKKSKNFEASIKPIRINLVDDESDDDFSDDLPDIDEVVIISPPVIKQESKLDIVKSIGTIPTEYDSLDDFESPAKKLKFSQNESKSKSKESTVSKSNLLFTSEHKNKLAKLLSAVSYKSKPKKSQLTEVEEEINESSEGSRHWMDCLDSLNQSCKIPNESDYQSDTSVESIRILASSQSSSSYAGSTTSFMQPSLRSVGYCHIDDSQETDPDEQRDLDKLLPICTKSKVSDTQDWIDQNVKQCLQSEENVKLTAGGANLNPVVLLRNIRVQPEEVESALVPNHSYTNQYYTSVNNVKFSTSSNVNNLVESFSAMHIYSLEAAMEEGDAFFDCSLDILKGFVIQNKPTVNVLNDILFKGLLGKYSSYICAKCYNILRFVWQTYPDLIQIDWDVLSDKIGGVTYQRNSSSTTNLQSGLLLHLYVFGFEINIFQNSIRNRSKLIRTFAFKLLSEDCAFSNLKLIITWIEFCINSSSHERVTEAFLQDEAQMPAELTEKHLINFDAPYKLLPDLNRLLELGIDISKNCVDASRRIASELEKTYIYVSDIKQKKILIHLVCSDLLRLKLVQRVMEDYCEGIVHMPGNFPSSFSKLKDCYFSARPPRSPLCTPPQSPNNGELQELGNVFSDYAPESVEELSLLVYYAAKSYLNCMKRCLHDPLHLRFCQKNLMDIDRSALETLPEKAMEFYRHLQRLNPDLTPAAQQNCIMLTCLSETYL